MVRLLNTKITTADVVRVRMQTAVPKWNMYQREEDLRGLADLIRVPRKL